MQKRTREILALVLLGLFALVGVGAMSYYILVGHNWNVAATHIDDSIGQMDDYTVILFEGTRAQSPDSAENPSTSLSEDIHVADIKAVAASYREKNAAVFIVDAAQLTHYEMPYITTIRHKRLGFMAAAKTERRSVIRKDAATLKERTADYIIAVTNDSALYRAADDGLIGNISLIICDDAKDKAPNGEYHGGTYCVSAPRVGEVGVVVISPSGVFSSKLADDTAQP